MKTRHYLERGLIEQIQAKDAGEVGRAIDSILKSPKASLLSKDENGSNFLVYALIAGDDQIIDMLYAQLKNSPDILWGVNNQGRSLISYAAEKNKVFFLEKLIQLAHQSNLEPWWLESKTFLTPLMYAAKNNHKEVISHILDAIKAEIQTEMVLQYINRVDGKGNTALHHLFQNDACESELIALLINRGANTHTKNNDDAMPINYLFKLGEAKQKRIFNHLNEEKKEFILSCYLHHLLSLTLPHSNEEFFALKKIYLHLAAITSLKALSIAKHELNDNVKIRATFKTQEIIDDKLTEVEKPILADVAALIPHFMESINNPRTIKQTPTGSAAFKYEHELLNYDRAILTNLINDIDYYAMELQNNPAGRNSVINKVLAVFYPLLYAGVYATALTLLWSEEDELNNELNKMDRRDPNFSDMATKWVIFLFVSLGVTIVGAAPFLILPCTLSYRLWNYERTIHPEEWTLLIKKLQTELIDKLTLLEEKSKSNSLLLPIDVNTITRLKTERTKLDYHQKNSDAINLLHEIKKILEAMRNQLNQRNKPLTQFFKPAPKPDVLAIDVAPSETDALLPKPKRGWRCNIL